MGPFGHGSPRASRYPVRVPDDRDWGEPELSPAEPDPRISRRRTTTGSELPLLAGVLSFLFPGLGQLAAGAPRRALAFAVVPLLLVAALAAIFLTNKKLFVQAALSPTLLLVIVAASLVFLVYRIWAIVDAYRLADGRVARRGAPGWQALSLAGLLVVLGLTVGMHAWVAYLGWSAHETLVAVFDPNGPRGLGGSPSPTASPTAPGTASAAATETASPSPTPTPVPKWAEDGRLNVLLIGSDAGPGRWSMRADAIILVSVDIATGRIAAFSVPRYTRNVPLPEPAASAFKCRCLSDDWFNALYVYANQHPKLFPGKDETTRGLNALNGAAEQLFGVHMDGMVVADLNGFIALVDAIGGVTIDIPEPVYDARYPKPDGSGTMILTFKAGKQHLDGWHALAYARTRHQDSDVGRMYRQQLVIQSLRREVGCDLLGKLPAMLDVARDNLWTNLPLDDVPEMLSIDPGPVESHVLFDTYNVRLTPKDVARVQGDVAHAFDKPAPSSSGGGGSSSGC
jgi:LCP family protein required for cell wall assembly